MKNIAIIPARSGSKGLPNKNIKMLNGKPLIAYTIEIALKSDMFDEVMVSTDSVEYAEIAKAYGAKVPFLRSEELSSDTTGSWEVVEEVLKKYKNDKGEKFDTVCLLQPTSPMRIVEDIISGYDVLEQRNADAVTSVCEVEHSPLWAMILPPDGSLKEFRRNQKDFHARQELPNYYRINGALYIRKIHYNANNIKILADNEYAYVMERERSIDIDVELDFKIASILCSKDS